MNLKEEAYYLRNKYDRPMMTCIRVRRCYPNISLDSIEMEMYLDYYHWMSKFLDGDKSIEHFIELHPEYKNVSVKE